MATAYEHAAIGYTQAESARFQSIKPWRIYDYHEVISDGHGCLYRNQWGRNKLIKEHLNDGIPIQYLACGDSLYPLVHHGDQCLFYPICHPEAFDLGAIVFCKVVVGNMCTFCVGMIMAVYVNPRFPTMTHGQVKRADIFASGVPNGT